MNTFKNNHPSMQEALGSIPTSIAKKKKKSKKLIKVTSDMRQCYEYTTSISFGKYCVGINKIEIFLIL
jgi:hypothetical protein